MINDLIYDVGMYNGDDTAYYLHKGYKVVGVEANPDMARECKRRFHREILAGRLVVLNVGITDSEGSRCFWINEVNPVWSSFDRAIASRENHAYHAIKVECCCFGSIVKKYGVPYYLKVDIEGNDLFCIEALPRADLPRYVSCEIGGTAIIELLYSKGYTDFKCIDQVTFQPLASPSRSIHFRDRVARRLRGIRPWRLRKMYLRIAESSRQRTIDKHRMLDGWRFAAGSSGPFGDDTPGQWQSYANIRRTWECHRDRHNEGMYGKQYCYWNDIHARLGGDIDMNA